MMDPAPLEPVADEALEASDQAQDISDLVPDEGIEVGDIEASAGPSTDPGLAGAAAAESEHEDEEVEEATGELQPV